MKNAILGFVAGAAVVGAGAFWIVSNTPASESIFPQFAFYDDRGNPAGDGGYVKVSGAVVGAGVGAPNNHITVECIRSDGWCTVASVEELDFSQSGNRTMFTELGRWPILNWSPDLIVVQSDPPLESACTRVTLNIVRRSEEVRYTREPLSPQGVDCSRTDRRALRWAIGQPPFWERQDEQQRERELNEMVENASKSAD